MKRFFYLTLLACVVISFTSVFAQESGLKEKKKAIIEPSAWVAFYTTRLNSYKWFGEEPKYNLFNNTLVGAELKANIGTNINIVASFEGFYGFNTHPFTSLAPFQPGSMDNAFYPLEANALFRLLDNDKFRLELTLGLFIYKYNYLVHQCISSGATYCYIF